MFSRKALAVRSLFLLSVVVLNASCTSKTGGDPAAAQHFATVVCSQGTIQKVVDAYPQSKMSQEELKKQTLGEGMARLQELQKALPTIVDPTVAAMKASSAAWSGIASVAAKAHQLSQPGKKDASVFKDVDQFAKSVKAAVQTTCADSLKNPVYERHAEFAVGAIVGYLGKISVQ